MAERLLGTPMGAVFITAAATAQRLTLAGFLNELGTGGTSYTLFPADSVTMSEALTNVLARVSADSVAMSEALTNAPSLAPADSTTMSDALSGFDFGKGISDTATPSEGLTDLVGKPLTDAITMTDFVAKTLPAITFADVITMSDLASPVLDSFHAWTLDTGDSVSMTDAALSNWLTQRIRTNVIDPHLRARVRPPESKHYSFIDHNSPLVLADGITLAEVVALQIGYVRGFGDTATPVDAYSVALARVSTDSVTMSDGASFSYGFNSSLTDAVTMSDSLASILTFGLFSADTATMSEALVFTVGKALADTATMSEALVNAPSTLLADGPTMSEAMVRQAQPIFADSVTMTETSVRALNTALADSVTMSDSESGVIVNPTFIGETFTQGATNAAQSISYPAGTVAGDFTIIYGYDRGSGLLATPSTGGWTTAGVLAGIGKTMHSKVLTSGDLSATITTTSASGNWLIHVLVFRNISALTLRGNTGQGSVAGATDTATGFTKAANIGGLLIYLGCNSPTPTPIVLTSPSLANGVYTNAADQTETSTAYEFRFRYTLTPADYTSGTNFTFTHGTAYTQTALYVVELLI